MAIAVPGEPGVFVVQIEQRDVPKMPVPIFNLWFADEVDLDSDAKLTAGMHYYINATPLNGMRDAARADIRSRLELSWSEGAPSGLASSLSLGSICEGDGVQWRGSALSHRERVTKAGYNYLGYVRSGVPAQCWGFRNYRHEDVLEIRALWMVLVAIENELMRSKHLFAEDLESVPVLHECAKAAESEVRAAHEYRGLSPQLGLNVVDGDCVSTKLSGVYIVSTAFSPPKAGDYPIWKTSIAVDRVLQTARGKNRFGSSMVIGVYMDAEPMNRMLDLFGNPFTHLLLRDSDARALVDG